MFILMIDVYVKAWREQCWRHQYPCSRVVSGCSWLHHPSCAALCVALGGFLTPPFIPSRNVSNPVSSLLPYVLIACYFARFMGSGCPALLLDTKKRVHVLSGLPSIHPTQQQYFKHPFAFPVPLASSVCFLPNSCLLQMIFRRTPRPRARHGPREHKPSRFPTVNRFNGLFALSPLSPACLDST